MADPGLPVSFGVRTLTPLDGPRYTLQGLNPVELQSAPANADAMDQSVPVSTPPSTVFETEGPPSTSPLP